MATRKSTWACAARLLVVTNASTTGLPRVASALTGCSSSESNLKSTGAPIPWANPLEPLSDAAAGSRVLPHPSATKNTAAIAIRSASRRPVSRIISFLTHELVFTVRKEHVESREGSVAPGDVLLELQFVVIAELGVGIDPL